MANKPIPAKLIFNPGAGQPEDSPGQLLEILTEMRKQSIIPEVHMPTSPKDVEAVIKRASKDGTRLIIAAGGDGTADQVAAAIAGRPLTLGIIPAGTRNNLALSLGIPNEISKAVELLRQGRQMKIDIGVAKSRGKSQPFLEVVTLGLLSDLYFLTDDIQHDDVSKVGEFISTLASSTPFKASIKLHGRRKFDATAFMILIANMQFVGANIQIDPSVSCRDGKLDIFVFAELSKINLVSYALRSMAGNTGNETVQHYSAKEITIDPSPPVSIIADGFQLTEGKLSVKIHPRALGVIAGINGKQYTINRE